MFLLSERGLCWSLGLKYKCHPSLTEICVYTRPLHQSGNSGYYRVFSKRQQQLQSYPLRAFVTLS